MKRRIILLSTVIVIAILLAMVFNLPGIAIAKFSSAASPGSKQSQVSGTVLTSKEYNLILQPAPAASGNSTTSDNTVTPGSHQQSASQTGRDALQGGNYMLSQPVAINVPTGCCCKNYLTCLHNK